MTLDALRNLFADVGCTKLYAKVLAENDNSKNQVYFGPGFHALNLFPNQGVYPSSSAKNPIFKADVRFGWLLPNGTVSPARHAKFILYPQYPEVRFSGFLLGSSEAPADLMRERREGREIPRRVLFLGVRGEEVLGHVVLAESPAGAEFLAGYKGPTDGVFAEVALPDVLTDAASRAALLDALGRIHRKGWIDSKQLAANGDLRPCNAPQCGGFTLEAELGIPKNSKGEPDFLGWEVKQHAVTSFDRPASGGAISLMTPEPTGGLYKEQGVEAFVRKFGYADKVGREDRMNFGGTHFFGKTQASTGLILVLNGYDAKTGKILDAEGALQLVDHTGLVAASWSFSGLLGHWSRKHNKAVYVPSMKRMEPTCQYHYGHLVRLAQGTDSLKLLSAFVAGGVYYDPGIKLERASTGKPAIKRRSQFRVASRNVGVLYQAIETALV